MLIIIVKVILETILQPLGRSRAGFAVFIYWHSVLLVILVSKINGNRDGFVHRTYSVADNFF